MEVGHQRVDLPDSVPRGLRQFVGAMTLDRAVEVVPVPKLLTPRQAAHLLAVPEPHLERLPDEGAILAVGSGANRRVPLDDVLAYRQRWDAARREGQRRNLQGTLARSGSSRTR